MKHAVCSSGLRLRLQVRFWAVFDSVKIIIKTFDWPSIETCVWGTLKLLNRRLRSMFITLLTFYMFVPRPSCPSYNSLWCEHRHKVVCYCQTSLDVRAPYSFLHLYWTLATYVNLWYTTERMYRAITWYGSLLYAWCSLWNRVHPASQALGFTIEK